MLVINYRSQIAIYEQIKTQIMELIAVGELKPHQQLPSIRSLAADLSLNFNTVKKAFGELESAGVIYTLVGRGCFVSDNALENESLQAKARQALREGARAARSVGLSREEAARILDEIYTSEIEGRETTDADH